MKSDSDKIKIDRFFLSERQTPMVDGFDIAISMVSFTRVCSWLP